MGLPCIGGVMGWLAYDGLIWMSEMMGRDLAPHGSVWPPFLQHAGPDFFMRWGPRAAKEDKLHCPRAFQTFACIVVASILLAKTSHLTEPIVRAEYAE